MPGFIDKYANPNFFMKLSSRLLPWLTAATIILLTYGLYLSLTIPEDFKQGATVKIMFIHVPMAWLALMTYSVITISSIGSLVWRHPLADVSAKTAAPIGAIFCLLALLTGSLWGRPMWGVYWAWDARLTSMLILFFLYLGLIAIWQAIEEPSKAGRAAAILALVGSVNLPIIKYSVNWWNTLHQPASLSKIAKPSLDPVYIHALLIMAIAFSLLFLVLHLKSMRAEILRRKIAARHMRQAERASRPIDEPNVPQGT